MKEKQEIKFQTVNGNLLDLFDNKEFDAILHGCNCLSSMSGGIARQIKDRYPQAYWVDFYDNRGEYQKLGSFSYEKIENKGYIYNLYTQFNGGNNFDINAFTNCLRQVILSWQTHFYICNKLNLDWKVGFPLIGCGIGGGNWEEVEKVIKEEFKGLPVDITVVKYNEE